MEETWVTADTGVSELWVQSRRGGWSRSANWGEEECVENGQKKVMGWPGLDQTPPSLRALWPNLCVCMWVYRYIYTYRHGLGLLQLACHSWFSAYVCEVSGQPSLPVWRWHESWVNYCSCLKLGKQNKTTSCAPRVAFTYICNSTSMSGVLVHCL